MKNVRPITIQTLGTEACMIPSAQLSSAVERGKRAVKLLATSLALVAVCLGLTAICRAQTAPAAPTTTTAPAAPAAPAPAAPTPAAALPTPAITGPLSGIPPLVFDAGPFGKISANGIITGFGMAQGNHVPGDRDGQADLSNGEAWIQKTDGWFQFYIQAGAYNLPSLATPFSSTGTTMTNLYGPVPVAFLKLQAGKNTSVQIGELPTLIGAEYTFTFENMNIERGLLWNQETAISRGIQLNQAMGKFSLSFSWNDGFYSNRYTWLSGSLGYTKGAHSLSFVAGGNYNPTPYLSAATPVQNDGSIYNVIYTFTKGPWIIQPYFQYTDIPTNLKVGIVNGATTQGEALLISHAFKHGFSLAGRYEYISSSGSAAAKSVNLMFGPGSAGTSVTVTPTFQYGGFFVRGEFSLVHASTFTPGDGFGTNGMNSNQPRAVAEIGFLFGNNLVEKKP
jgi:hypothetical protein